MTTRPTGLSVPGPAAGHAGVPVTQQRVKTPVGPSGPAAVQSVQQAPQPAAMSNRVGVFCSVYGATGADANCDPVTCTDKHGRDVPEHPCTDDIQLAH